MYKLFILFFVITLVGCEATPVKNTSDIQTEKKLLTGLKTPVQIPVAFYVDKSKPKKRNEINFIGKLEEATQLVAGDMFASAEKLSTTSNFQYLFNMKVVSTWDRLWGGWRSNVEMTAVNRRGESIFSGSTSNTSGGAGLYDFDAVYNSLAMAVKELMVDFLNKQGPATLRQAVNNYQSKQIPLVSFKELLKNSSPSSTGTGFFIDKQGSVVTAAHVIEDCVYIEVMHKGKQLAAGPHHQSALLDLAVINTDYKNTHHAIIGSKTEPELGKQVFVASFPLSGLLSDYPSLTVGNVSSKGGLRGAKGSFQFSAPVQPGSSGGAIVDYKGNLIGVVSGSLNQAAMLRETEVTAQNLNFGVELGLLKKFLDKKEIQYATADSNVNFEKASADAVEYTNQVLCYN